MQRYRHDSSLTLNQYSLLCILYNTERQTSTRLKRELQGEFIKITFLLHRIIVKIYVLYCWFILFYICEELVASVQILPILNLCDIASKFRTIAMFVTVKLQAEYHTQYVGIYMFYLYTKFHKSLPNTSVDIINISKCKWTFCIAADVDFTEKEYLSRSYIFFYNLIT
jgi:hypothetical protein